ncbi:N-acetylglutamate synthase, GNAT family [Limimonas halophila]|uniref:N-acetylglutamate synthase, GNAT family n=1 Tax=Limimonas halophila TaxID=1082479 RepID=A0A1G7NE59_9PROT|nr:GNAT family N-acetyltransferase [Limimonas halophila]SDF72348.1 N-acetylglutamate synthase, GNAT family [Limimonas halophila]
MTQDTGTDLAIRHAAPADAGALDRLWDLAGVADPSEPAETVLARTGGQTAIFLGESAGEIVASAVVSVTGAHGWLEHVCVHPGSRRRGYGRQLVRAAEIWLSEQGAGEARAVLDVPFTEAMPFAHALGYGQQAAALMARSLTARAGANQGTDADDALLQATITHLEMRHPPTHPPPHAPAGKRVALMRAERPTVSFYRFLYNTVGEQWLWWERRTLSDDVLARIIQDERSEIYVLYVDGSPAGFAELEHWRPPMVNLAYIGLLPEYIGQGFGRYLLGNVIDLAWQNEISKLTVSTNTLDHHRAISLYQRMGFEPVSQEVWTMHDPRVVGLIPAS